VRSREAHSDCEELVLQHDAHYYRDGDEPVPAGLDGRVVQQQAALRLADAGVSDFGEERRRRCASLLQKVSGLEFCFPVKCFEMDMYTGVHFLRLGLGFARVRCARRGGIRFTVGGNPWFLMVLIHNVGGAGDVKSVRIKGSSTGWYNMYRNWGALWTVRVKISGALTFAVTTSDGRTVVARNAVGKGWKFGQTWEGAQFR
jgi:hypothetical protein